MAWPPPTDIRCAFCDKLIFWDDSIDNELTGAQGYWRDIDTIDTTCHAAPDNHYGQQLHSRVKFKTVI